MSIQPKTFSKEERFDKNPQDFYPTPMRTVIACLATLKALKPDARGIADPGCGTGVWGRAARHFWRDALTIGGCDIVNRLGPHHAYTGFFLDDFLKEAAIIHPSYDLVIGNPPFSSKEDKALARKFIERGIAMLNPRGYLGFLLKTEAVHSQDRYDNVFSKNPPIQQWVLVQRPSFNGTGNTNTIEYSFFIWAKQNPKGYTELRWLDWKR